MARKQREPQGVQLAFNEPLTKVPNGELLKRLQVLHKELAELEQDTVDTASLDGVRAALIERKALFLNKDRGVRAYTACCLADLLRLYAPDAPYSGNELKDIFEFFIDQLKGLTGPQCPNFHEYFYIIESLANVKSAVLICETPNFEKLIEKTFKSFFDLAKPDLPKNALSHLADILTQLIEEAPHLSTRVVDLILMQYLPKTVRSNPTATNLAVETCSATSEKLQRYVAQYFTETILSAATDGYDDLSDSEEASDSSGHTKARSSRKRKRGAGKSEHLPKSIADSSEFIIAHELIESINRTCPSLLTNVIPQLEEELTAEDAGVRVLAAKVLGGMFSDRAALRPDDGKNGKGTLVGYILGTSVRSDLAKKFPSTWLAWLGRAKDTMPSVRITVMEAFKDVLRTHHELSSDVYEVLRQKLTDPDERVRVLACNSFSTIDYESALRTLDKSLLIVLSGRIQDKKPAVQREALTSLARFFDVAFGEIANGVKPAIDKFGWIPHEIIKAMAVPDRELMASAGSVLHEYVLPLPSRPEDESAWVDRLLHVMQLLDAPAQKNLFRLSNLQDRKPSMYATFLDVAEKYNGGTIDGDEETVTARLKTVFRVVSGMFPDPAKAEEHFHKFAKLNDNRCYKLLRTLMDTNTDLKTIIKAKSEVIKRLEASSPHIVDTFAIFIRKSALLIISRSSVPQFFRRMQSGIALGAENGNADGDGDLTLGAEEEEDSEGLPKTDTKETRRFGELSQMLLELIAKHRPELFVSHISELSKSLLEEQDSRLCQITLYALSQVVLTQPHAYQRDRHVLDKAFELATSGTPLQAKYAATFLARVPDNEEQCQELVADIALALPASSGVRLLSYLNALKRLSKHAPRIYQAKSDDITPFVIRYLRKSPHLPGTKSSKTEADSSMDVDSDAGPEPEFEDWCNDEDFLPEHEACIVGLKILTYRCLAAAPTSKSSAAEIKAAEHGVAQTIKVMSVIIAAQGQPKNFKAGPGLAGRFRLQAAVSLLRLATVPIYEKQVGAHLHSIAWMVQDQAFQVRGALIHKLVKYSLQRRIRAPRWTTVLFLTAHDPDYENIMMAQRSVIERTRNLDSETKFKDFDTLIVRLIHMLAHHPDFQKDSEDLKFFVKYIEFFLDCLGSKQNIPVLYLLAGKVKSVRDSESQGHSENLYTVSELAQYVIRARAQLHGWSLDTPPISVKMPSDIFKPLPSSEVEKEIRNQVFLPDDLVESLGQVGKAVKIDAKLKSKAKKEPAEKKRKASPKPRANGGSKPSTSGSGKKPASISKRGEQEKKAKTSGKKKDVWEEKTEDEDETAGESSSDESLQAYEDELAAERAAKESKKGKTRETRSRPHKETSDEDEANDDDAEEEDEDDEEEQAEGEKENEDAAADDIDDQEEEEEQQRTRKSKRRPANLRTTQRRKDGGQVGTPPSSASIVEKAMRDESPEPAAASSSSRKRRK